MGVAALVLGIIAIVCGAFLGAVGWIGLVVGVIGIVLGALGKKKALAAGQPTGIATAGLVCSIIGTGLCLVFWLACAACVGSMGGLGALMG